MTTTNTPLTSAKGGTTYTPEQIKKIIDDVATSLGVDPKLAEADAIIESGGNPYAVGDNGTSFGLYQLHKGGELGNLTPQQAFDPATNARVALTEFSRVMKTHPAATPGQIAALAERPANPGSYATHVQTVYNNLASASDPANFPGLTSHSAWTSPTADKVAGAINDATNIASLPSTIWGTISNKSFWVRVAFIVGGLIVILIGVEQLTGTSGGLRKSTPATPLTPNDNAGIM